MLVNLQEAVEHELSRQRRLLFYVDPSRSELTTNAPLSNRPYAQPNVERVAQYREWYRSAGRLIKLCSKRFIAYETRE